MSCYNIINHAINNISYYKKVAKDNNFTYSYKTIFDDVKKLPVLTKNIIRTEFYNMKWQDYKGKINENTSGGSTGEPVKLLQDVNYTMENWTEYSDALGKHEFGEKVIYLWGSERDILIGTEKRLTKILNKFYYRKLMLNTFRMSEKDMELYVKKINYFKPKAIIAYVQSAYELAKFIERKGLSIYSPKGIIVSAGTLYPDMREIIERVFKCEVFNRYGSREVGNMAMECDKHEGLHLNIFAHYIEILDKEGNPVKDGEQGELYVTLLTNYAMPLIRFQIGDMAIKSSKKCSCGRGWPLVKTVTGRTVNVFKTENNTLIDGEYFTHLFYGLNFINKFQVIQEDYNIIFIKIEIIEKQSEDILRKILDDISSKIKLVMGDKCIINYEVVDEILPLASGKYIYTISKIN